MTNCIDITWSNVICTYNFTSCIGNNTCINVLHIFVGITGWKNLYT